MNSLVSVIMPAYNASKFIGAAIETVLNQTYSNIELIIIDDCSTDNTNEIIQYYVGRHSNIIHLKNETNLGPGGTRNRGINIANGEYIAFLDSDDLWEPSKIEKQVGIFNVSIAPVGVVYCWTTYTDSEKSPTPKLSGDVRGQMLKHLFFPPSSSMVKTSFARQAGGFAEDIRIGEDWQFFLNLSLLCNFTYIGEPLLIKRGHDEQLTKNIKENLKCDKIFFERFLRENGHMFTKTQIKQAYHCRHLTNAFYNRLIHERKTSITECFKAWKIYPLNVLPLKSILVTLLSF